MKTPQTASIFFLFFVSSLFCQAQGEKKPTGIQWMTIEEALKQNEVHPRKIYIDMYTKWCGWCKRMDATTFEDPGVIAYMNAHYYPVKMDAETKDTIVYKDKAYTYKPEYKSNELAAVLLNGQMSYPTSVYLNEKNDLIGPLAGYLTPEQLLPVLKYFGEDQYKTKKWEVFLQENFSK